MKNDYEIRGDVTSIFIKRKGEVYETLIDTADLLIAQSFEGTWCAMLIKHNQQIYAYGVPRNREGKQYTLRLHRLLLDCPIGKQVDHINRNTLDNRRSNLRIVTNSQNRQNLGIYSNNKSGYRGVYWHKRDRLWIASISINGKCKELGRFREKEKAAKVAYEARKKIYPYATN